MVVALPPQTYYDDTALDNVLYPPLEGELNTDICIIGGGFSGVATALTLAERGREVILLEASKIGRGASGRNGGQWIAGFSGESTLQRQLGKVGVRLLQNLRYRGHEILMERLHKYKINCDWKPGWMEIATRPRDMDRLRRIFHERHFDVSEPSLQLVEQNALSSVLNSKLYYGGLLDRRSGHLHPLNLCRGEARAANALGVQIYEDSEVLAIKGGRNPFAKTKKGKVFAQSIVLAGDTYHNFERGRLRGLQFPTGSYMIATEPLRKELALSLNPEDLSFCDTNTIPDYFRMTPDRRILFGGRCNYSNRDPKDVKGSMHERLLKIFPQLSDTQIDYAWAGRIGIVFNRVPAIGRVEPNFYYLQGYCGHGLNVSHIAAEIVADAICGTSESLELFERIRHIRIPFGRWAGNTVLALSMLYYRIRELTV